MNPVVKKILGFFLIALAALATIYFIKRLPPIMKLIALAADVITIYYAVGLIKSKLKPKTEEDEQFND